MTAKCWEKFVSWNDVAPLVGKSISKVEMNETWLVFTEDNGTTWTYSHDGECCTYTYFYDFIGANTLIRNGKIVSGKGVPIEGTDDEDRYEVRDVYGVELVTEHEIWGEQTSLFSFRAEHNGYYGGWMTGPTHSRPRIGAKESSLVDISDTSHYTVPGFE